MRSLLPCNIAQHFGHIPPNVLQSLPTTVATRSEAELSSPALALSSWVRMLLQVGMTVCINSVLGEPP
jgi:hypothetical protein